MQSAANPCLGSDLWAGFAGLEEAPKCKFFPRQWYGCVTVPGQLSCHSILFLGGSTADLSCNDVWRFSMPLLGSPSSFQPCWTLVSEHDTGQLNSSGQRIIQKWRGRHDFGCCAVAAGNGTFVLYVAAGAASTSLFGDVWASEDGGATWVCMTSSAPWPARRAPALCAVAGRPEVVLLVGGLASYAEAMGDAWVSQDAGASWAKLVQPSGSLVTGRYRAALFPLPVPANQATEVRMLLLGGCFIGAADFQCSSERLLQDAFECCLDLASHSITAAASWVEWGSDSKSRGSLKAKHGLESATCAHDEINHVLIAKLPDQEFVSTAHTQKPAGVSLQWQQAHLVEQDEVVEHFLTGLGEHCTHVRFCSTDRSIPRLAFANKEGLFLTGSGEWRRQFFFGSLLGVRLERLFGISWDLWVERVLTYLLPVVHIVDVAQRSMPNSKLWKVVGSGDKGGIIVREGRAIHSAQLEQRLSYNALLKEEALVGERLQYTKLSGYGPLSGWVSVSMPGRKLVKRVC